MLSVLPYSSEEVVALFEQERGVGFAAVQDEHGQFAHLHLLARGPVLVVSVPRHIVHCHVFVKHPVVVILS